MAKQGSLQSSPTRDQMIQYAEAVHIQKMTKKMAYEAYVDNTKSDTHSAVARMERGSEYQAILQSILADDNVLLEKKIAKVRKKYVDLIEKNIDSMSGLLDASNDGDLRDKATAVRLANETISALQIVDGPREPGGKAPGKINKSGVIS